MIYSSIFTSKTNLKVPSFIDGKPFHSKYDPEREAAQFVSTIQQKDFFLIGGIGAGYHLKALAEKFPESKILALENSREDLDFLISQLHSELSFEKNISFTTIETLQQDLINNYIPAIYSTFGYIDVKSWASHTDQDLIVDKINSSIKKIAADFSVQAHFGKVWQKNILENLKYADTEHKLSLPTNKTAIIVAAGPSLDEKIDILRVERCNLFIISTDTGFKSLLRNGITPDAVVSIDGQFISSLHFSNQIPKETLYVFELTGNSSAARKIHKNGGKLFFSVSEHPFEKFIQDYSKESFLNLDSTSGTVTVAAVDFARKNGFEKIQVLGADFGYINQKPYTKGTYLDDIYLKSQDKLSTEEKNYSALMYRTELISEKNKKTTETLLQYENNFLNWCAQNGMDVLSKDNVYHLTNKFSKSDIEIKPFDLKGFMKYIKNNEKSEKMQIALLPMIAFLKNKDSSDTKGKSFDEYSKLALNFISRYNF